MAYEESGQSTGGQGYFAGGTQRRIGIHSVPDNAEDAGLLAGVGRQRR